VFTTYTTFKLLSNVKSFTGYNITNQHDLKQSWEYDRNLLPYKYGILRKRVVLLKHPFFSYLHCLQPFTKKLKKFKYLCTRNFKHFNSSWKLTTPKVLLHAALLPKLFILKIAMQNILNNLLPMLIQLLLNWILTFGGVYFASWIQNCAGVILPLVEHDWLKYSHDKYDAQRDNLLLLLVLRVQS